MTPAEQLPLFDHSHAAAWLDNESAERQDQPDAVIYVGGRERACLVVDVETGVL